MSSVKWFDGDSVQALQKVKDENCVFLVYIEKGDKKLSDIFYEPDIIQLLNNELIVCFKMDSESPSYENFNKIFNNIVIPSIYVLEKNNMEQFNIILKKLDLLKSHEVKLDFLDLKIQILNSIYSTVKNISDSLDDKEKYLQFMTNVSDKLQNMIVQRKEAIGGVQNLIKYTKIKIKVPCLNITIVKEFETTDTLNEVKMFVLENITIPKGPIKFISERQFTDEDFNLTLHALNLCPTSTIYVHKDRSDQYQPIVFNFKSWLYGMFHILIIHPFNYMRNIINPPAAVEPKTPDHPKKMTKTTKKFPFKTNIHTLRNNKSDDENNTYNGNSTQQM